MKINKKLDRRLINQVSLGFFRKFLIKSSAALTNLDNLKNKYGDTSE